MKKLLIFLLLFAFGFGAYCDDWVEVANQSYSLDGSYDHIPLYTVPDTDTYRIKIIVTSCTAPNTNWGYQTNIWKNGSLLMQAFLHTYDYFPCTATSNKALTAGDILTVNCQYAAPVSISFQVIIYKFVEAPAGEPPVITSPVAPSTVQATAGQSFSYTITADGTAPITFSTGGAGFISLPDFLTFDGVDTISGTIPVDYGGNISFTVHAINAFGSDSETVTVIVTSVAPPVITSGLNIDCDFGGSINYTITATGDPTIIYSCSGLPAWLSFNGTNNISGTEPNTTTTPYDVTFDITATNSVGFDTKTVTISLDNPGQAPVITSSLAVPSAPGQAFSYTITATGDPTIVYSAFSLPAYLTYSSGVVSGTVPAEVATFTFGVTATNSYGSDSKTVTAGGASGTGLVDTDNDVPAINAMSTAITGNLTELIAFIEQNNIVYWSDLFVRIDKLLTENTFIDMIVSVKEDINLVKDEAVLIKTNVIEINDTLTRIEDLITLLDTNQGQKLENIKGVLDSQLIVQQNQLTTQESILALLEQIANPDPDPPNPDMPDDPGTSADPEYDLSVPINPDEVLQERELKEYEKTFPMFDTVFRQRSGALDYTFKVPLNSVTPLLDDRYVNFNQGILGDFVSGIRAILSCILFYFTLKFWFLAVRRITD